MRVKRKLQLNVGFSIFAALALLLMLVASLQRLDRAQKGTVIAGNIISASFENSAFRYDYLQGGSERARQQWFSTQKEIGRLLATASTVRWDEEDALLLRQIQQDYDAAGKLFSELVAGRQKMQDQGASATLAAREKRLLTQLVIGSYDTVLHARKLQESSREHLQAVIRHAGIGLLAMLTVLLGAFILSTWNLTKLLTHRFAILREGTTAVGAGNLDHAIGLQGDDEFADLSHAFDDMTAKLRQSYLDLEKEVAERRQAEEAARASEERLRSIFDNAGVGIVEVAGTDRFIAVNDRICEMLGYRREQLLQMDVEVLTAPEDRPLSKEMNRRIHAGETSRVMYDKRYLKADGSILWVHVNVSAVKDGNGKWGRSITTIEDISSRKTAEEALHESEARFRGIFENASVGITIFDRDSRLLQANDKFFQILGYSQEELLGRSFHSFTHPDDINPDRERFSMLFDGTLQSYDVEKRYLRKDGSVVWVRVARSAQHDATGKTIYSISMVQDITTRKMAEENLHRTTQLLSAIMENTPDFLFVKDREGRMLIANKALLQDLGKSADEVIGKTDAEFLGDDAAEQIMKNDQEVMSSGQTVVFEEILHPEGDRRVYLSTKSPYKDNDGKVIGLIGIARDITKRKHAEESVRETERLLRTVLQILPVGVWILDAAGNIQLANEAAQGIWGEARYVALDNLVEYKGWRTDSGKKIEPSEWGGVRAITRGETSLNTEVEIESFDGTRKIILDSAVPIRNEEGEITGAITVNQEITDRKRAEEALRQREEQLHLFVEHAPAAIAMFDREMRYLSASRRWSEVFRLPSGNLQGVTHFEAFPDLPDRWREYYARGLAGHVQRAEAERLERADGSVQWIRWEIRPWYDRNGEVAGIVIFAEDMTESKRIEAELRRAKDELEERVRERTEEVSRTLEELRIESAQRIQAVEELRQKEQLMMQQARLAAMGEMLVNISHQWRQPLNVLNIIIQDLGRNYDRGKFTREYLGNTITRGKQLIAYMSQTIDDFRSFLDPDRSRSSFDTREAVEKAMQMVADSMREIEVRVAAEEPVVVDGFPKEYVQVIINILMNARDALREREVASPVIQIRVFTEGTKSVVTIGDNAGGISDEIMGSIFDPYFTTKGPDKGTGIGLYMAKMIIERSMEGSLTVRNTAEGAEFRIEV
jgi:PAS domain S-box-containing protein